VGNMFQPCNCCGCTLYSSSLSNSANFDSYDGGARYVSKFTLPEPDYQIWFGNLLSNTIASNQLTSNWLYYDDRWCKLELVTSPGTDDEVVHFEQTFRTARQSGFGPGALFANAAAQSLLESAGASMLPPATLHAHILYSEGTLGQLLHVARRYIAGSTSDGYIVDNAFTQRPLVTNPFLRIRSDYLETMSASDALYQVALPYSMNVGKSFGPFESRYLVPVPQNLHLRCSFSEPKDGILTWSKIQNAARDRPETCPQNETCANAPRRNKPKWKLTNPTITGVPLGAVDRHGFGACLSQSRTQPTLDAPPLVLQYRYTQVTYLGVYGGVMNQQTSTRRSSKLLAASATFEPSAQIIALNASLVPSATPGKQKVSINSSIDSLVGAWNFQGNVAGSTRDELRLSAWADPADASLLGATLSAGWNVAEFGDAPPHQLPPTRNGQTLESVTVVESLNATFQMNRDVTIYPRERTNFHSNTGYLESRYEVSGGGDTEFEAGLAWQAEFDAYEELDPPDVEINGSHLTITPPAFDAAISIAAVADRKDDDDVIFSYFRLLVGYQSIDLSELSFTLAPFGADSFL
jgi:hypothetical protein